MADNPYVNKVQYGNQVLIDITDSTVEPNALLAGYKAYGADGAPVTGTLQLTYHITLHNAQYEALSDAVKEADENYFYIDDLDNVGVEMDDTIISASKVWSSQKVNNEIDTLNSKIDKGSVSVTSDGVKTISTLMNTLYALIDKTKISKDSVLVEDDQNGDKRYYYCGHYDSSVIIMSGTINVDTTPRIVYDGYGLRSTGSAYVRTILSNTVTSGNYSTQTPSSGRVYTFYY